MSYYEWFSLGRFSLGRYSCFLFSWSTSYHFHFSCAGMMISCREATSMRYRILSYPFDSQVNCFYLTSICNWGKNSAKKPMRVYNLGVKTFQYQVPRLQQSHTGSPIAHFLLRRKICLILVLITKSLCISRGAQEKAVLKPPLRKNKPMCLINLDPDLCKCRGATNMEVWTMTAFADFGLKRIFLQSIKSINTIRQLSSCFNQISMVQEKELLHYAQLTDDSFECWTAWSWRVR